MVAVIHGSRSRDFSLELVPAPADQVPSPGLVLPRGNGAVLVHSGDDGVFVVALRGDGTTDSSTKEVLSTQPVVGRPVLVNDLNGDGVDDVLFEIFLGQEQQAFDILFGGANGTSQLGPRVTVPAILATMVDLRGRGVQPVFMTRACK